jgi:hypothetical protein
VLFALVLALGLGASAAAQGMKDLKRGPWDPKDAPPSWVVHTSKHYQIQSHAGAEKAERLAEHMETMLTVYKRLFPRGRAFKRFAVKLFADHREFLAYGAPPGAGAYYSPVDREMVCYDTGKWMDEPVTETPSGDAEDLESMVRQMQARSTMDILGAAAHEGWHQFFHWYVTSWIELPSWINEGMGDYFYAAKPHEQAGKKIPAELGRMNEMRLPVIRSAVKRKKHVPVEKILGYSQREYYANPGVCYAEGWALCQFLLHSENPEYRKIIPDFIRLIEKDGNVDDVTKRAFRGIDLAKLEEEWIAWVLVQRLPWEKPAKVEPPNPPAEKTSKPPADKDPGAQPLGDKPPVKGESR